MCKKHDTVKESVTQQNNSLTHYGVMEPLGTHSFFHLLLRDIIIWWRHNLLTSWFADAIICWRHNLLTSWFADAIICWRHNLLTSWFADAIICWRHNLLTSSRTVLLASLSSSLFLRWHGDIGDDSGVLWRHYRIEGREHAAGKSHDHHLTPICDWMTPGSNRPMRAAEGSKWRVTPIWRMRDEKEAKSGSCPDQVKSTFSLIFMIYWMLFVVVVLRVIV